MWYAKDVCEELEIWIRKLSSYPYRSYHMDFCYTD